MKCASIEATNKAKRTPLHYATQNGYTCTMELLLTKGAAIEAMDIYNNTPWHFAALRGCTSTVQLLLMKGASIEAMNKLPYAMQHQMVILVQWSYFL